MAVGRYRAQDAQSKLLVANKKAILNSDQHIHSAVPIYTATQSHDMYQGYVLTIIYRDSVTRNQGWASNIIETQ